MKKKINIIIACLIFCILFGVCGEIFRYILIDDINSYTRITFHEMYEQDNIDVLFVGSSHCYRTFIPKILDKELGLNTFNAGTSSQKLDGSYMIIKEAVRYNNIKHIYLELYYEMAFSIYKSRVDMTQTYLISDYLRPSLDKVEYLLEASASEHYMNSFIVARRNWKKFFDIGYVKKLLIKKQTNEYKNYEYAYVTGETEWYAGKGYVANEEIIEDWNYFSERGWENINLSMISDDWKKSLRDIITFCEERNISLTLLSVPMPNFLLAGLENYDDYIELVRTIIADTNVEYYDFNLCQEKYFPNESNLFKDTDHVNCYGAEVFSYLFANLLNGRISANHLFYHSYKEKMASLDPTVFGISYYDTYNNVGKPIRECKIISTLNDNLEYKIILKSEDGGVFTFQKFSKNRFFTVNPNEHGICTIVYRLNNFSSKEQEINILY